LPAAGGAKNHQAVKQSVIQHIQKLRAQLASAEAFLKTLDNPGNGSKYL
jgi:hypothetical protein